MQYSPSDSELRKLETKQQHEGFIKAHGGDKSKKLKEKKERDWEFLHSPNPVKMESEKDFAEHQVSATCILSQIFHYLPDNPELFSGEVQQELVTTSIDKAIFIMQMITGFNQLSCSEIVHTTYESLNPNLKPQND